jgi:hypothetical protein
MEDLKQKILADIYQTGFVTELLVGKKLIKAGWRVSHGASYFDVDTGKSRELDIIATRVKKDEELDFYLVFQLVTQVKSSKRPWVIFTSPITDRDRGWLIAHCIENFLPHTHLPFPEVGQGIMRENISRSGTAFHEAFKAPSETSQIFEAVVSACKATSYQTDSFARETEWADPTAEDLPFYPHGMKFLRIFIPLVVIDGLLFEAFLDDKGEVQIDQRSYIPVDFTYSQIDRRRQGTSLDPADEHYFPDVITLDGVESYLGLVENWQTSIFSNANAHIRKHLSGLRRAKKRTKRK